MYMCRIVLQNFYFFDKFSMLTYDDFLQKIIHLYFKVLGSVIAFLFESIKIQYYLKKMSVFFTHLYNFFVSIPFYEIGHKYSKISVFTFNLIKICGH